MHSLINLSTSFNIYFVGIDFLSFNQLLMNMYAHIHIEFSVIKAKTRDFVHGYLVLNIIHNT